MENATLRQLGRRFNIPGPTITGWQQNGVPTTAEKLLHCIIEQDVKIVTLENLIKAQQVTIRTLADMLRNV